MSHNLDQLRTLKHTTQKCTVHFFLSFYICGDEITSNVEKKQFLFKSD